MTSLHTAHQGPSHSRFLPVALCCAAIIVDGYDLIVYGTGWPTAEECWRAAPHVAHVVRS
ncbi:hypothetical protein OG369_41700 [Streptomyces sp. NBC_01221]|uniref:hypothetical protein n=1 Tax=unclassified Streptomyces TaxID=2593676 RepID=UPI0022556520|nr:hypothetical protein [Streptomyces sp. NBC_01221]MCX4792317.1 hypothetical protein [Streptomyces sp. NBC_01221]WTE31895.1 hypothetical protein OH735_00490 [Streptomyces sp. NBC_01618]